MTTYRRASDQPQTVQSVFGGIIIVGVFAVKFSHCTLSDLAFLGGLALGIGVVFRTYITDLAKLWRGGAGAKP